MRAVSLIVASVALFLGGCSNSQPVPMVAEHPRATPIPAAAKVLLEKAEDFELLSLHPIQTKERPKDSFHGWKVLGKMSVKEPANHKRLVEAFEKGNTEFKTYVTDRDKERPKTSFSPRHAIRVTHEGKTADFVISFAGYQAQLTVNGGKTRSTHLSSLSPASSQPGRRLCFPFGVGFGSGAPVVPKRIR